MPATAPAVPATAPPVPVTARWTRTRPRSVSSGSIASMPSIVCAHGQRREPAREHDPDFVGREAGRGRKLAAHLREQPFDHRPMAQDGSGPDRGGRVAPDRAVGEIRRHARQACRSRRERLEAHDEARGDRAAHERAIVVDRVERRGRAAVDDDGRDAVQVGGGVGVHETVRPDVTRALDPDREGDRDGGRREAGESPGAQATASTAAVAAGTVDATRRTRRPPRAGARRGQAATRGGSPPRPAWRSAGVAARRGPPSTPSRAVPRRRFVLPTSIARSMPR